MSRVASIKSANNILYEIQHKLSLLKHEIMANEIHPRSAISKIEEIETLIGKYKNEISNIEYLVLDEEDGWPD